MKFGKYANINKTYVKVYKISYMFDIDCRVHVTTFN